MSLKSHTGHLQICPSREQVKCKTDMDLLEWIQRRPWRCSEAWSLYSLRKSRGKSEIFPPSTVFPTFSWTICGNVAHLQNTTCQKRPSSLRILRGHNEEQRDAANAEMPSLSNEVPVVQPAWLPAPDVHQQWHSPWHTSVGFPYPNIYCRRAQAQRDIPTRDQPSTVPACADPGTTWASSLVFYFKCLFCSSFLCRLMKT